MSEAQPPSVPASAAQASEAAQPSPHAAPEVGTPTPWQLAADEMLAAMLTERRWWEWAVFECGLLAMHFPPGKHRQAFLAINLLRLSEQPTHLTAVVDQANGTVPLEWLSERALLAEVACHEAVVRKNAAILRTRGTAYAQLQICENAASELRKAPDEEARRKVIASTITRLGDELGHDVDDATALAGGERFMALLESKPQPGLSTGVNWVDQTTGGIQPGELWWIAGAYKMRKSSVMRNIALGAARDGASVTIITLESPQQVVIAQLVTMMAGEWLLANGLYHEKTRAGTPLNAITARQLLTLRANYRTALDPRQVAAVQYGLEEFKRLGRQLRIYDATPANGGVRTLADVYTILLRDRNLYGANVLCLDYLQRLSGRGDTIFERTSQQALELQNMALRHKVAFVVLAQRNEETIRTHEDEHSPGVKGGGDPAATADYLFLTRYPVKNPDTKTVNRELLQIELRLARHGEAGQKAELPIHPASGWLLPE